MDRQTGRIAARARASRDHGRTSPNERQPNESTPALLANWLRRLDTQSRWYILIALGFALGFIVPAVWAYHATGSYNEAVAVLQVRPPLQLLASSMPSVGLIAFASILGAAATMILPAAVRLRRANRTTLGPASRWTFLALAAFASFLLGPLLAAAVLQLPGLEGATWPWGTAVGSAIGGATLLLAISAGEPRGGRKRRRAIGVVAEYLGLVLAVVWVFPLGWAMCPTPRVSVDDSLGNPHAGLLLDISAHGIWMIEEPPLGAGPGTFVLIDADPATFVVATD